MLTCKQASQLISQSLDQPLSLPQRLQLKVHLFLCGACRRFRQQLHLLRAALQQLRNQIENDRTIQLTPEAKDRITRAINTHQP